MMANTTIVSFIAITSADCKFPFRDFYVIREFSLSVKETNHLPFQNSSKGEKLLQYINI